MVQHVLTYLVGHHQAEYLYL